MEKLPVIFRAEKSGPHKREVTAVFPTLQGTGPHDMTCYAHIGQHSTCTPGWYAQTRLATPDEYKSLLAELRGIYETRPASNPEIYGEPVKLEVRTRTSPQMRAARMAA